MKLQILVPRHNEPEEVIKPLLDSLAAQHNVDFNDFGVIICDDGSDNFLSKKFLNKYPYEIINLKKSHSGVSQIRNYLLDNATADYIMYCDADDMFFHLCGISIIFDNIERELFNAMYSVFVEETIDQSTGKMFYLDRDQDNTFVHGKVYRREYLIENNIRWLDHAIYNEDAYFNFLAIHSTENRIYVTTPFYMWCYNKNSVCRSDPKYTMKTLPYMIDNDDHLVDEFLKRGNFNDAVFCVVNMILETYYNLHKEDWILEENKEYIKACEKRIGKYIIKYSNQWDLADDNYMNWVWENLISRLDRFEEKKEIEEPLESWLFRMIEIGKE